MIIGPDREWSTEWSLHLYNINLWRTSISKVKKLFVCLHDFIVILWRLMLLFSNFKHQLATWFTAIKKTLATHAWQNDPLLNTYSVHKMKDNKCQIKQDLRYICTCKYIISNKSQVLCLKKIFHLNTSILFHDFVISPIPNIF